MAKMYYGSIDLTKIDESRIVETDINGQPFKNNGRFANIIIWVNDEADQFGNHATIQQSVTKEERDNGKKIYLGNLKLNQK